MPYDYQGDPEGESSPVELPPEHTGIASFPVKHIHTGQPVYLRLFLQASVDKDGNKTLGLGRISQALDWLIANDFEPDTGRSQGGQAKPASDVPECPQCAGEMYDNRPQKKSGEFKPNSPDFKCRNKECGKAIWPEKK